MAERESYPLEILLQAPSKAAVNDVFVVAFQTRFDGVSPSQLAVLDEWMQIGAENCEKLLIIVRKLIGDISYSCTDVTGMSRFLPPDFHESLAKLIMQIVSHHLPEWRSAFIDSQVSLPRLVDVDWRVDVKSASESITRMAVPTCLVELQVQGCATQKGTLAGIQHIAFEMNRESLGAMLDGLGKIRDQLSQVSR